MCLSRTTASPVRPRIVRQVARIVGSRCKGPSDVRCFKQDTHRVISRTESTLTGDVNTGTGSVVFADNNARTSGRTVFKATRSYHSENGRVVAARVRRRTILRTYRRLRGRNFRMACLPISPGKHISMGRMRSTLQRSAVLMAVVCKGGRVKALRPVGRVNRLLTRRPTGFRASTIRTCKLRGVSIRSLGISLLSISTRGVGNPGKVNFLCTRPSIGLSSQLFNNRRREGHETKARGIPSVTNFRRTIQVARGRVRAGQRRLRSLEGLFVGGLGRRNTIFRLGKSLSCSLPRILGLDFPKAGIRTVLIGLSLTKVTTSDKSTYATNSVSPSRILIDVFKGKSSGLRGSVHFDFNLFGAGRRTRDTTRRATGVIGQLTG